MALELLWTKPAQQGYDNIVLYLEKTFTEKEVKYFITSSNTFFNLLTLYPNLFEQSPTNKNLHRGPINKYTILTYRVKPRKNQIELINIRGARQKPLNS